MKAYIIVWCPNSPGTILVEKVNVVDGRAMSAGFRLASSKIFPDKLLAHLTAVQFQKTHAVEYHINWDEIHGEQLD